MVSKKNDPLDVVKKVVDQLTKDTIKRQEKLDEARNASDNVKTKGRPKGSKNKPKQPKNYVDAGRQSRVKVHRRNKANIDIDPPIRGQDYEDGKLSLMRFIEIYCKHMFPLPFSNDHVTALDRIEQSIKEGGLYATCCPRSDGKTTRTIASILWCVLYGHKKFVVIVAADADAAKNILTEVMHELGDNELIARDWPGVSQVVRGYIDSPTSLRFTIVNHKNVRADIKTNKIVMPTCNNIPCASNGVIMVAKGLTASLRGIRHKREDGEIVRPDYVICDDIQTDESASSPIQVDARERLLTGAILGLAGPNTKISAVMNATVIQPNDLAARMLDHDKHPEWNGYKAKLVYEWSKAKELWEQYAQLRKEDQGDGRNDYPKSTEFYLANRVAMDEGCIVGWEHRYRQGELSAIQHAYNLLIDRGQDVFDCEYQNEPKLISQSSYDLDEKLILSRLNGYSKHTAPVGCEYIVVGADINYCGINWCMLAARKDASAYCVDWGKYPENIDMIKKNSKENIESIIATNIYNFIKEMEQKVVMVGNQMRRVGLVLIDCGFSTDCVINTISAIKSTIRVLPVRGVDAKKYRTPKLAIFSGRDWHISRWDRLNAPVLSINADLWRESMQRGFLVTPAAPSSISLYGNDHMSHIRLAKEIASERLEEKVVTTTATYYRWVVTVGVPNDLGDAMNYAYCGIHVGGANPVSLPQMPSSVTLKKDSTSEVGIHTANGRQQPSRRPRGPILEY